MSRRFVRFSILLLSLALVASACSDDGDDESREAGDESALAELCRSLEVVETAMGTRENVLPGASEAEVDAAVEDFEEGLETIADEAEDAEVVGAANQLLEAGVLGGDADAETQPLLDDARLALAAFSDEECGTLFTGGVTPDDPEATDGDPDDPDGDAARERETCEIAVNVVEFPSTREAALADEGSDGFSTYEEKIENLDASYVQDLELLEEEDEQFAGPAGTLLEAWQDSGELEGEALEDARLALERACATA